MFNLYAIDRTVPNHGHMFIGRFCTRREAEGAALSCCLCQRHGYLIEVE